MNKSHRWKTIVIFAAAVIALLNIFPTTVYYSQPLKEPLSVEETKGISEEIKSRIADLHKNSTDWLESYLSHLSLHPTSIAYSTSDLLVTLTFPSSQEAEIFKKSLPRAVGHHPFPLETFDILPSQDPLIVTLSRKLPLTVSDLSNDAFVVFSDASTEAPLSALDKERLTVLASEFTQTSLEGSLLEAIAKDPSSYQSGLYAQTLAERIYDISSYSLALPEVTTRILSSFTQCETKDKGALLDAFYTKLELLIADVKSQAAAAEQKNEHEVAKQLRKKAEIFSASLKFSKEQNDAIRGGHLSLSLAGVQKRISTIEGGILQASIGGFHPFIEKLTLSPVSHQISIHLHPDVMQALTSQDASAHQISEWIRENIFSAARRSGEIAFEKDGLIQTRFIDSQNLSTVLAVSTKEVLSSFAKNYASILAEVWKPSSVDLQKSDFPIQARSSHFPVNGCSVFFRNDDIGPHRYLDPHAIYVRFDGIEQIRSLLPEGSVSSRDFEQDLESAYAILTSLGFQKIPSSSLTKHLGEDAVFFVCEYPLHGFLMATREGFSLGKHFAILECTNHEARIHTLNKIDDELHDQLIKQRDQYQAAIHGVHGMRFSDAAKPTKNVLVSNFMLTLKKLMRGDERKIMKWGLDLSGGKSVVVELRDATGKKITDPVELKNGVDELYRRVNKLGVSEVAIRTQGSTITLDFPGSQEFSASELIKASTMAFHVVNEQFSPFNGEVGSVADKFLQSVWNEAVLSSRTSLEELNAIAFKKFSSEENSIAQQLRSFGLRLADPQSSVISGSTSEELSSIAVLRGEDPREWGGASHPLLIVFHSHTLDGADLHNIHASYDPQKGNYLSFSVTRSSKDGSYSPQQTLGYWTGKFSKAAIQGTELAKASGGRGWRMAVVLNGSVVSAPTLESKLESDAMISGSFTQREVLKLESDLKAGALTYFPKILSESNVSPELGAEERSQGIQAAFFAMVAVIVMMGIFYRYMGLIASVALLFNMLLMWAVLQNFGATLTLAGIASAVLTMGMAVDANVLIYERMKEEIATGKSLTGVIKAGYEKAFSAIFDSNLTTIIAAVILLSFDSGPIKGFAIILIIGIVTSMFTALFCTKWFLETRQSSFSLQHFSMPRLLPVTSIPFLRYGKTAIVFSLLFSIFGLGFAYMKHANFFGMDFTGGYATTIQVPSSIESPREAVSKALIAQGVAQEDFDIRELSTPQDLRILLSTDLDSSGKAFSHVALQASTIGNESGYQKIPRLHWLVNALSQNGVSLSEEAIAQAASNWDVVSGQMSSAMWKEACFGLVLSLLAILVYLAFRFEGTFAFAATLGLAFDVLFTFGAMALLNALGVAVQLDLKTVAAIMTIVGYSLNDTIIIFDRVRDELKEGGSFATVLNRAANSTLSRTIMTSMTTLITVVMLLLFGGHTLFGLSCVLCIGIVYGTGSSLVIALPLLYMLKTRAQTKVQKIVTI